MCGSNGFLIGARRDGERRLAYRWANLEGKLLPVPDVKVLGNLEMCRGDLCCPPYSVDAVCARRAIYDFSCFPNGRCNQVQVPPHTKEPIRRDKSLQRTPVGARVGDAGRVSRKTAASQGRELTT